jgi:hypothetical protein
LQRLSNRFAIAVESNHSFCIISNIKSDHITLEFTSIFTLIETGLSEIGKNALKAKETNFKYDKVKKNAKGGVLITTEEIQTAFSLLDAEKSGITLPVLKKRLGVLFPGFSGACAFQQHCWSGWGFSVLHIVVACGWGWCC